MKMYSTIAALCLAAPAALAQDALVIATGSTGGTYYPVGVGLAQLVSGATDLNMDAVTSGGSTENVRLIGRDEVDMAITNGVVGTLAVAGQGPFESGAQENLRSMFALWGNTEHQVALTSAIDTGTVDDLAALDGKYNIGGRQSGARTAASLMLGALGHDAEAIETESLSSYSEAGAALQDGRIAAANMGAGIPVAAVTELYASLGADEVTILSFTDEQLGRLDAAYPGLYYRAEIPAGSYPGQDAAIATA
jgi:TRAP transporter TAXI family solute receptor